VLAGQKAFDQTGEWLPQATLDDFREYRVGIKGPLTTPVGGGIRSLNVALRQILDLYVCLRPVRWYPGVPSPVRNPQDVDMVIFRENTEDIYAGIEWQAGTDEVERLIDFLHESMGVGTIRFPETSSIGVKPISEEGTKRLVRSAIHHAREEGYATVTLVRRMRRGERLHQAHRCHSYQLAVQRGFRVPEVTNRIFGLNIALILLALLSVELRSTIVDVVAVSTGVILTAALLRHFERGRLS